MKKLFIILVALFLVSPCFASTAVHLVNHDDSYNVESHSFEVGQQSINTTANSLGTTSPVLAIHLAIDNNTVGQSCYIGGSNVTTSTGMALVSGQILTLRLNTVAGLYAIALPGGSVSITVMVEKP